MKNKTNYVFNHDYGYCSENNPNELIDKLELRDISDLKLYLADLVDTNFFDVKVIKSLVLKSADGQRVRILVKRQNCRK